MRSRSRRSATRCSSDSRFSRNKILASSAARVQTGRCRAVMQALGHRVGSQNATSGVARSDALVCLRQSAVEGSKKQSASGLGDPGSGWTVGRFAGAVVVEIGEDILAVRLFIARRKLPIFCDPANPEGSKQASLHLYGRSVRVLSRVGGAVGIRLDETDSPIGFCKASDLTAQMPLFD
jgi:hypothetical protein